MTSKHRSSKRENRPLKWTNPKTHFTHWLLLSTALLLGTASPLKAQLFVGAGGQIGYFNLPNANAPVDYFNSKGFLFKPLRQFHWPAGFLYHASYRENRTLLEVSFNSKKHRTSAESVSNNTITRRDHRFSIMALNASLGHALLQQETFLLYLIGGLDLGYFRYSGRFGNEASIHRINYQTFDRKSFLGLSTSLRFTFRPSSDYKTAWSLGPYLQLPLSHYDFRTFNIVLNPNDFNEVGTTLPAHPWNCGILMTWELDLVKFLE